MQTWKADLEAHRAEHADRKVIGRLMADLPINSQVAVAVVDDPLSSIGEKIHLMRSVRNDPLAGMYARQQIDEAQFAAGRLWQRHHEASEIGSIQAIDPAKEAVDGGKMRDPISDKHRKAFIALGAARCALGASTAALVFDVLAKRVSIRLAAESRGFWTDYGWKQIGREFRAGLDTLAVLWGLAGKRT